MTAGPRPASRCAPSNCGWHCRHRRRTLPRKVSTYLRTRCRRKGWRYTPPDGHTVAWLAVDEGRLRSHAAISAGELAVFEESGGAIELEADGDTSFVLGSAIKHPHPLVLGYYSVHTSKAALAQGEAEIDRIGQRLRAAGRL